MGTPLSATTSASIFATVMALCFTGLDRRLFFPLLFFFFVSLYLFSRFFFSPSSLEQGDGPKWVTLQTKESRLRRKKNPRSILSGHFSICCRHMSKISRHIFFFCDTSCCLFRAWGVRQVSWDLYTCQVAWSPALVLFRPILGFISSTPSRGREACSVSTVSLSGVCHYS